MVQSKHKSFLLTDPALKLLGCTGVIPAAFSIWINDLVLRTLSGQLLWLETEVFEWLN